MITVAEALELVRSNTRPLEVEHRPLEEACGLVLAEDVVSPVDIPFFTNSAMDGYAVRSADLAHPHSETGVELAVRWQVKAGDAPSFTVGRGECARIMTGAMLPAGADAVVRREDAVEKGGRVWIRRRVEKGDNVRRKGEEVAAGQKVLRRGEPVTPAAAGLLAEMGVARPAVHRNPRVTVVVTGDEVAAPGEPLEAGKVRDANTYTLRTALECEGFEVAATYRVGDDPVALADRLAEGLARADVLLVTGGVSVGDYDFVKGSLERLGVEPLFWRVAQKPGKPLYFGRRDGKLVFGLPGNPGSALVCYYVYVREALWRMRGLDGVAARELEAVLDGEVRKAAGRTQFVFARIVGGEGGVRVVPAAKQGSNMLCSLITSDALVVAPAEETHLRRGVRVRVVVLPGLGCAARWGGRSL